jgi:hypothetical protein
LVSSVVFAVEDRPGEIPKPIIESPKDIEFSYRTDLS